MILHLFLLFSFFVGHIIIFSFQKSDTIKQNVLNDISVIKSTYYVDSGFTTTCSLTSHLFLTYCDATDGKLSLESINFFCVILNNYVWQRKQRKPIQQLHTQEALSSSWDYWISERVSLPHLSNDFLFEQFSSCQITLFMKLGLLYHPA